MFLLIPTSLPSQPLVGLLSATSKALYYIMLANSRTRTMVAIIHKHHYHPGLPFLSCQHSGWCGQHSVQVTYTQGKHHSTKNQSPLGR